MKIEFIPKIKQKDLENNQVLFNNKYFRDWVGSDSNEELLNCRIYNTARKLTAEFKERYGKQSTTFRSEFTHYVYAFNYKGYQFHILTGNKGTSIEVSNIGFKTLTDSEDFGKIGIEFITLVWKEIGIEV